MQKKHSHTEFFTDSALSTQTMKELATVHCRSFKHPYPVGSSKKTQMVSPHVTAAIGSFHLFIHV